LYSLDRCGPGIDNCSCDHRPPSTDQLSTTSSHQARPMEGAWSRNETRRNQGSGRAHIGQSQQLVKNL
jgi:hypothetical protein